MTTVGFIGLGIMGGPMAANLVKAGFDVIGYNRSRDKVGALISVGGQGADDVAGAVRGRRHRRSRWCPTRLTSRR